MTLSIADQAMALGLDPDDPNLMDQLMNDIASDLEEIERIGNMYPLAQSILWRNDEADCDQRRAVLGAMGAEQITLVMGGWRSGKSEGLKQLTTAFAMGESHPAVRAWLTVNDLPFGIIPEAPSQVYAIAQSSNDSMRYHRSDFDRLVGPGRGIWFNRSGKGEASLVIPVPGFPTPGRIWFKSVDQKRRSFQGISIPWWWIDEEPLGEDGAGVVDELKARAADQAGKGGISMIPTEGITWLHDQYVRDGKDNVRIYRLDSLNNPHNSAVGMRRLFAGLTDDELAVRRFGEFRSRAGLVYGWLDGDGDRFGPGHMCDDFDIPADWPRFRGADFGLVNPTCVLWGALGDDDTLYIYREQYEAGPTYQEHGERVKVSSAGESISGSWGDPSASEVMSTTWAAMDVYFDLANREVKAGIDQLRNRMRVRGDGRPRLKVMRRCPMTIREMKGYRWDPMRVNEVPVKKDDHACDALRYLSMGIEDWRGL